VRVLVDDDKAKAEVKRVLDFAQQPENYYKVGPGGFSLQKPPGDDPRHVAHLVDGFRCVFSLTRSIVEQKTYRHLTISIPSSPNLPNPYAAFMIAQMFGFTGWDGRSTREIPADWQPFREGHAVGFIQEV
jgi:hypothetical protein